MKAAFENFCFPDPPMMNRNQPITLMTVVGKQHPISIAKEFGPELPTLSNGDPIHFVIGGHLPFANVEKMQAFLADVRKRNYRRQYITIPTFSAYVLTKDPKNGGNEAYQRQVLTQVFKDLTEDPEEEKSSLANTVDPLTLPSEIFGGDDDNDDNSLPPALLNDDEYDLELKKVKKFLIKGDDAEAKDDSKDTTELKTEQKIEKQPLTFEATAESVKIKNDLLLEQEEVKLSATQVNSTDVKEIKKSAKASLNDDAWLKELVKKNYGELSEETKQLPLVRHKLFNVPEEYEDSRYKIWLIQMISRNSSGELLEEPVIISRGFFKDAASVEEYKNIYFGYMLNNHPKQVVTNLDLISVPVNQPFFAYYSRSLIGNIIPHMSKQGQKKLETEKKQIVDVATSLLEERIES